MPVKRTILKRWAAHRVARRATAAIVAGVPATQNVACGTTPKPSEMRRDCGAHANPMRADAKNASDGLHTVFVYQKRRGSYCALNAPAGRYTVGVSAQWSNGWTENVSITSDLAAESGQHYVVNAYQKKKGRMPVTDVRLHGYVSTSEKVLTYTLFAPFAVVYVAAIIVTAPPVGEMDPFDSQPTH